MTRNKSKRPALIKYALAAPIFLILTAALASPETPILAKTEALSDKVVSSIDNFEKEKLSTIKEAILNQNIGNQSFIQKQDDTFRDMKEGQILFFIGESRRQGNTITPNEMRKIEKLQAIQIVNGQPVDCEISSYILLKVRRNQDPYQVNVTGATNIYAKDLFETSEEGDFYQFLNIKAKDKIDLKTKDAGSMSVLVAAKHGSTRVDTTFKPLIDLKLVDEKQIGQMDIESKEEFNTRITITFKDGHLEYFKGTKADMEKVFKKENVDATKLEAEQKAMVQYKQKLDDEQKASMQQVGKLDEMVVVGHGSQKSVVEQKAQKLEDEKKAFKLQLDKQQAEKNGAEPVFTIVEQNPEFPQGIPALYKFLGENIKYPKSARDAGGQGTVFVGFVVEKDGSITDVKIKKDAPYIVRDTITLIESNGIKGNKIVEKTDYSLGKEAVRVISMMPNWKPGKQDGKAVRVAYTLPIKFKLD